MGKRKSSKKPQAKKGMAPLSSSFKCLFCHHEKAVSVKMDKASMFGHLNCKICGQKYTTPINNLSVAVDVYCDWVDACEEIREKQPKAQRPIRAPSPLAAHGSGGGANIGIRNRAIAEADEEEDAEGDEEEEEEEDANPREKSRSNGGGKKKGNSYQEIDHEEDEDEEDEAESRRDKRRRVDQDGVDEEDDED